MKKSQSVFMALFFMFSVGLFAQDTETTTEQKDTKTESGHTNQNKFRQLYQVFSTPNQYRTASGAPGPAYYQNMADYKMEIVLNDREQILTGTETITYHNNSPNDLRYLWLQLDQNIRAKDSKAKLKDGSGIPPVTSPGNFVSQHLKESFDGGFNITEVSHEGEPLSHDVNFTMMRINLPEPLESGESYTFKIEWWYNINNYLIDRGRSGYEHFEEHGNNVYIIAQFYPRMAVYNDVEGWQNHQFWGSGEFALPFGDYEVSITVPADHILDGTGKLVNREDVFSDKMMRRYEKAKKSFEEPVFIVTQEEAEAAEKGFSTEKKTWTLKAEMVRDFAFTSSRKFIWDMMAVDVGDRNVMAVSLYPKEGNPLWEDFSTKVVASTLKSYSNHTFEYPYHKAISVHAKSQGMEYPMICWNYGRPNENGEYSDRTKYGMMSVIIHEVGHNFFPMIVNSDERQWGWMDEGINTFMQYIAEQEYGEKYPQDIAPHTKYPSRRGVPSKIVPYMKGDQDFIAPIMANPEFVYQLGNNAYGKPATALNILRETIMGEELFDYAFKTYAQRWMFKHPTPEDFFRTMEDASAVDLDWFWRGWFYTTDFVDIGVKSVKQYYITDEPTQQGLDVLERYGVENPEEVDALYVVEAKSDDVDSEMKENTALENAPTLNEYLMDNFSASERTKMEVPKYFYEVTFEKPGGLVMPIIAEYTYADGSTKMVRYPVQIWRKNDSQVSRAVASNKEIVKIVVDPDLETADINVENNTWPQAKQMGEFEKFKEKNKG